MNRAVRGSGKGGERVRGDLLLGEAELLLGRGALSGCEHLAGVRSDLHHRDRHPRASSQRLPLLPAGPHAEADLRRVRLHDLRHTAASLLLAQGVPARVVMEILGHSQISVTLNTYTHVDTSLTETALNGMESALWPSGEWQ